MAEGARLESVFRGNSNVGSNPTLSAINQAVSIVNISDPNDCRQRSLLRQEFCFTLFPGYETIRIVKCLLPVVLLAASLAAAEKKPLIRICVGPLDNHSSYQLPIEKLRADFVTQLSHKNVKAVMTEGGDPVTERTKNNCDYLVAGEFTDFISLKSGETVNLGGVIVDNKKKFAQRFKYALRERGGEKPVYSRKEDIIDKNPKTCADDQIYLATKHVREYFK